MFDLKYLCIHSIVDPEGNTADRKKKLLLTDGTTDTTKLVDFPVLPVYGLNLDIHSHDYP